MNKRGAALILSYAVILVLTILASAFLSSIISENNLVRRYEASSQAFWAAEAGLANAYHTWSANRAYPGEANTPLGEGTYTVTKTPLNPQVTVTGTVGTTQRTIHAQFVGIPRAFDNVFSIGGDLNMFLGILPRMPMNFTVNGNTRYSGSYVKTIQDPRTEIAILNPAPEPAPQNLTTISIPDYNGNGTDDEFDDFVQFGRKVIAAYPPEQTIYIKSTGASYRFVDPYTINLQGKKVVFIEDSEPGGLVVLWYDPFPPSTTETQDLTIISTGEITNCTSLGFATPPPPGRVNTVSWGEYAMLWPTQYPSNGVYYSHSRMFLVGNVPAEGTHLGNYITNGNMSIMSGIDTTFNYSDRAKKGDLPPGFEFLGTSNGTPKLIKWSEE